MPRVVCFVILLLMFLLGAGGASEITCPGGAGAYDGCLRYAVTIKVKNTTDVCSTPGTIDPPTPPIVKCEGGGNMCVELEFKVKRISDGAECAQTKKICDGVVDPQSITCFGKTFTATLVSGTWAGVVSTGNCALISGVSCP